MLETEYSANGVNTNLSDVLTPKVPSAWTGMPLAVYDRQNVL